MRASQILFASIVVVILVGCESWQLRDSTRKSSKPPKTFQSLRMPADSVVLEIAVATMEQADLSKYKGLWREIDTSCVRLDQRKVLDQNGIRAGIISSHIPASLQQMLEPDPIDEESLDSWQSQLFEKGLLKPKPKVLLHDGIQNRKGESHPVPVSQTLPEASWIVKNGTRNTAGAGTQVRAVMEVKTYPNGDGTVRIVCTPTLHLGQPRPQIGVSQQAFIYENSQDKQLLDELSFELCLRSGESAIIGPTSDLGDLGALFFANPNRSEIESDASDNGSFRFLMVRLLQTQMDDLFESGPVKEKLSSTSFD